MSKLKKMNDENLLKMFALGLWAVKDYGEEGRNTTAGSMAGAINKELENRGWIHEEIMNEVSEIILKLKSEAIQKQIKIDRKLQSYYDTTHVREDLLQKYDEEAQAQDRAILTFFEIHKGQLFTPYEIHRAIEHIGLITSVRRAMTNLTNDGLLIRTYFKRKGIWNRDNYLWTLRTWGNVNE